MDLLVIRHAIAEDREVFARSGEPDSLRPLTAEGRRKMERVARGLRSLVPALGRLATSPYTRAAETARIVAHEYKWGRVEETDVLVPDVPLDAAVAWLSEQAVALRGEGTLAVVGHEPHLSRLVTWLLTEREGEWLELKKGGACLLALDESPRPGAATLRWLLAPRQLRRLDA